MEPFRIAELVEAGRGQEVDLEALTALVQGFRVSGHLMGGEEKTLLFAANHAALSRRIQDKAMEHVLKAFDKAIQARARGDEDLVAEIQMTMVRKARTYDPTRGARFSSYIKLDVEKTIVEDRLQRQAGAVSLPRGSRPGARWTAAAAGLDLDGMAPSEQIELVSGLRGLSPADACYGWVEACEPQLRGTEKRTRVLEVQRSLSDAITFQSGTVGSYVSLDAPFGDEDGNTSHCDMVATETRYDAADAVDAAKLRRVLVDILNNNLPANLRVVVAFAFGRGWTLKKVAQSPEMQAIHGRVLSPERIRQLRKDALAKLKTELQSAYPDANIQAALADIVAASNDMICDHINLPQVPVAEADKEVIEPVAIETTNVISLAEKRAEKAAAATRDTVVGPAETKVAQVIEGPFREALMASHVSKQADLFFSDREVQAAVTAKPKQKVARSRRKKVDKRQITMFEAMGVAEPVAEKPKRERQHSVISNIVQLHSFAAASLPPGWPTLATLDRSDQWAGGTKRPISRSWKPPASQMHPTRQLLPEARGAPARRAGNLWQAAA